MARTFVSQPNQIFSSEAYDDTLAPGVTLQTNSTTLERDLNAIRTQIRQLLWAGVSGSWYDAVVAPSGSNSARGVNSINVDLTDLEQKRFLFRRQNLNIIQVATGSNFVLLSASLGTTPLNFAAVGASLQTGSVVSLLGPGLGEGVYGSHSMAQVSGSTVLTPKNLVLIRDAYTGLHLTGAAGKDIYGLIQVESGTLSGDAFNDTTHRTQISFVVEAVTNNTASLVPTTFPFVGGRVLMYSYPRRTALDDIPEDAYFSNSVFLDVAETFSGSFAQVSDITLDRAIDNQVGTVTQNNNIAIQIAAGFSWTYLSGTKELWKLTSSDSGDSLAVAVDSLSFNSTNPADFSNGIKAATGLSEIDLGVFSGTINTLTGTNLVVKGGNQLNFADFFGGTSTYLGGAIPFATSTLEWNNFSSDFGNATSILGALHILSQSASGSLRRVRYNAGTTGNPIVANTNVTFPTNLDAALGNYTGRDFKKDLEIYLNGILLLPGTSADQNDVYPGTAPASGDLKFPYQLRSGSQIAMVVY